ncbi:hypothetical protein [Sulfitobacter sp. R18_1]|uniref:hypothetical protein n=1 Tax=Sulfitobacter sp. R18_1 TaxID=2821104 RepID=UPI001ADC2820|nr:hypothetical protein [Sulfitobacter sp. R18_1]MBO9428188.1 hypothetical protein [Sulfitobacter sp. R18_1]
MSHEFIDRIEKAKRLIGETLGIVEADLPVERDLIESLSDALTSLKDIVKDERKVLEAENAILANDPKP